MTSHCRASALSILLLVAAARPASAQLLPVEPVQTRGTTVHFVPGVMLTSAVFGDDTPKGTSTLGISLGAKLCHRNDGPTALVAETTYFPIAIRNPHYDERLRPLHTQIGGQWGRGTYLRLTGGISIQFWSEAKRRYTDIALAMSAAVGREMTVGSTGVAPEAVVRLSAAPGIGTLSIGAQAVLGTCAR